MTVRTFEAQTMAQALALVKRHLGPDAVILRTRVFRRGGVLGLGSKERVEITASRSAVATPAALPPRPARSSVRPATVSSPHVSVATNGGPAMIARPAVPAAPAEAAGAPAASDARLSDEVRQIRQMVHRMMRLQVTQPRPDLSDVLFNQYLGLLEQEVSEELAEEVIEKVGRQLIGRDRDDPQRVRQEIRRALAELIPVAGADAPTVRISSGRPLTLALVGPTGVGKTTTIAKLAANFKLRQRKRVALLTIDTYRIAAVDQLRTYAQIIHVPLFVAMTPAEVAQAMAQCADYEVVLIDTAGRSQRDDAKLRELAAFLDAAEPHEVHLVLSCTASQTVLIETVEHFKRVRVDRVLFTKLDEAVRFGVLVNVARRVEKRLSYVTMGQEVPHHIEAGEPGRLAGLILGEKL